MVASIPGVVAEWAIHSLLPAPLAVPPAEVHMGRAACKALNGADYKVAQARQLDAGRRLGDRVGFDECWLGRGGQFGGNNTVGERERAHADPITVREHWIRNQLAEGLADQPPVSCKSQAVLTPESVYRRVSWRIVLDVLVEASEFGPGVENALAFQLQELEVGGVLGPTVKRAKTFSDLFNSGRDLGWVRKLSLAVTTRPKGGRRVAHVLLGGDESSCSVLLVLVLC